MRTSRVAAVALLVSLAGCASSDEEPGSTPSPSATSTPAPTSSPSPTEDPAYVTGRVTTGTKPCGILGVAGRVWVSNYADDSLVSVDPDTLAVSDPVTVGHAPCGLAHGAGSIWVEDYGSNQVTRVSVRTGQVQGKYSVGAQPYDVTYVDGAAWVTNYGSGTVSRIDARTGRVTSIRVGGTPIGVAPGGGAVWVGLGPKGIAAIDTGTREVRHLDVPGSAGWTAYDDGHVWVNVDDSAVMIDTETGAVGRTVQLGPNPEDGSVVAGQVWIGDQDGSLRHVATDDGEAVSTPSGVGNPFVVAGLGGRLWVVDFAGTDVVRIDPDRVP